jgi:hypothetical protein
MQVLMEDQGKHLSMIYSKEHSRAKPSVLHVKRSRLEMNRF